jgi:hypothetical protein
VTISTARLHTGLDAWAEIVRSDPEFRHISRQTELLIVAESPSGWSCWVTVQRGSILAGTGAPARSEPSTVDPSAVEPLHLTGDDSAWRELLDPHGAPRRHDLLALSKQPDGITIEGGRSQLIRHLRVINRLVEIGKNHG